MPARRWGVLPPLLVHRTKFPPLGGGHPPVTRIAHKHRVISIRIAGENEVSIIIKAALAFTAKPELVFIPFG